jgi:hypothetical protein
MSNIPVSAIRSLVDYLRNDERKDFEAKPCRSHIFHSVRAVDRWLAPLDGLGGPGDDSANEWQVQLERDREALLDVLCEVVGAYEAAHGSGGLVSKARASSRTWTARFATVRSPAI